MATELIQLAVGQYDVTSEGFHSGVFLRAPPLATKLTLTSIASVVVLAGVYVWRQLRRRAFAAKFTNVDLLRNLVPKGIGARRHVAASSAPIPFPKAVAS